MATGDERAARRTVGIAIRVRVRVRVRQRGIKLRHMRPSLP